VAKQQPERRFTLLYDKVCRQDILQEAWQRVKSNKGAAGVDQVDIDAIRDYGEGRFLSEVEEELRSRRYRTALVRRVHIPKPGQPGKTRPLGIPTVKDRVVQMAVKLVIEPLFEADFMPCSFGFRPKKTPRMALSAIVQSVNEGYTFVVDVDLKSYFDTISHELLLELVQRRVGDVQVLRLIRAWLKAGVMEEGKVTHPDRGSPQGGVISRCPTSFCMRWIVNGAGATGSLSAMFGWSVMRTTWCCWRGRSNRHGRRGSNCKLSLLLFDWW
jgi:group II intron reverse transcriptase/maturase